MGLILSFRYSFRSFSLTELERQRTRQTRARTPTHARITPKTALDLLIYLSFYHMGMKTIALHRDTKYFK